MREKQCRVGIVEVDESRGVCKVKSIELKIGEENVLFFDLDGTLVETDYANFLAYNKAVNIVLNKSISYNPGERFTREKLMITFPYITKAQFDDIVKIKEECFKEFLPKTKLNKKAYDILNKYSKTNRTILVTNCRKSRALMILQYYDLQEKFERMFFRQCSNDKVNKFKRAMLDLNIAPQLIIVFENNQDEILNAIEAGIPSKNIVTVE